MTHAFDAVSTHPELVPIIVAMLVIGRIANTYFKTTAQHRR